MERLTSESLDTTVVTPLNNLNDVLLLIKKITYILTNTCNKCLTNFTSKLISAEKCKNTCSYTSTGLAVFFRLMEQNTELTSYIYNEPNITSLPIILNIIPENYIDQPPSRINDINYKGIVNTIGLTWDIHDFPIAQFPEEKYRQYKPTGIYYALQHALPDWFIEGDYPQLQPGINIISFYGGHDSLDPVTIHHSFVYVLNDICILSDSWNGRSIDLTKDHTTINLSSTEVRSIVTKKIETTPTPSNKYRVIPIGEIIERPLTTRLYSLPLFQEKINIMNQPPNKINIFEKINIMKCTFDGYKNDNYNSAYKTIKICILKQEKLDELMREGFSADKYLYGGSKNKRNKTKKSKLNKYSFKFSKYI